MLLTGDEHCIGRLVEDMRFQIESTAVSGKHCKIYRKNLTVEGLEHPSNRHASVFLKDTRFFSLKKIVFVPSFFSYFLFQYSEIFELLQHKWDIP